MLEDEKSIAMSASRAPVVFPKQGEASKRDNGGNGSKRRYNKRKEGQGSEYGYNRSAATKQVDRSQRPRGPVYDRQREEMKDTLRSGQEALTRSGSKKANLNHLLNFHYESRRDNAYDYGEAYSKSGHSIGGRNKWKKWSTNRTTYNKEQFLQANCQFIVKDESDYMQQAADPDSLVDWILIEQVKVVGNHVPSCPICLDTPKAARITKCGHIYCWSCMLHYLALSEKSWGKCPICYDAVQQKDLKSVVAMATRAYCVGDEITMQLMKRERGSTYCMPVNEWTSREGKPLDLGDPVGGCFAKLLTASPDQVLDILKKEMSELVSQKAELGDTLEGSYVEAAMELLKERRIGLHLEKDKRGTSHEKTKPSIAMKQPSSRSSCVSSYAPLRKGGVEYVCAFSDEEVEPVSPHDEPLAHGGPPGSHGGLPISYSAPVLQAVADDVESQADSIESDFEVAQACGGDRREGVVTITTADGQIEECSVDEVVRSLAMPTQAVGGNLAPRDEYFFYQAGDGQHKYMHNLNTRCLIHQYGSLECAPATITATIVELHSISMNQMLRERLRYLDHLPLTCEFQLTELALKAPLVSEDTLHMFSGELEKRQKDRQRKEREEKKQLKQMQNRQYAKYRQALKQQPWLGPLEYPDVARSTIVQSAMPALVEKPPSSGSDSLSTTPVGSPPDERAVQDSSAASGQRSFAQMLRSGKTTTNEWPSLKKTSSADSKPPNSETEGPKKGSRAAVRPRTSIGSLESDDESPAVPDYTESFGSSLQNAMESWNLRGAEAEETPGPLPTAGKGKKKKKVKQILFSTSLQRTK